MRQIARTMLLAAACAAIAGQVFAHAHLKSAVPAPDSTIKASPTELDLTFSEELNLKFSGIKLTGPKKAIVKIGEGMLMDKDATLMVPVDEPLAAGDYTVEWHALSADGHKTKGKYRFTLKP